MGRPASHLPFKQGRCVQYIEIYREGIPQLIERNVIDGSSALQQKNWGLNGANSFGSCIFTVTTRREEREAFQAKLLQQFGATHQWGVTQKEDLLIVRYIGNSAHVCRAGFELLWHSLRPGICKRPAMPPRIWAT